MVNALTLGNSIIEADIENIKSIAIAIAEVLFLANFMYFYSPFTLVKPNLHAYSL